MRKTTFVFAGILSIFFVSCGNNEKTTEETNQDSTATDTAAVTDTSTLSSIEIIHPVSDWAERNPEHSYFNSAKVDELVNGKPAYTPTDEEAMDYTHDHLNKTEMSQLTVRELLYYILKYPCSFSQICAADEWQDSTKTLKIPGYLPFSYSGGLRSEWQDQALKKRRDSVLIVMNDFIGKNPDAIDDSYLQLLLDLKAVESIPVMIKTASEKNLDNYSFLLALMMESKYEPFQQTGIYQRLYGDNAWRYGNRIEATKENIDSVKTLARQLHNEYKSK